MKMEWYTTTVNARAIRWDGTTEMYEFLAKELGLDLTFYFAVDELGTLQFRTFFDNFDNFDRVSPGEWLICQGGEYFKLSDEAFQQQYRQWVPEVRRDLPA